MKLTDLEKRILEELRKKDTQVWIESLHDFLAMAQGSALTIRQCKMAVAKLEKKGLVLKSRTAGGVTYVRARTAKEILLWKKEKNAS